MTTAVTFLDLGYAVALIFLGFLQVWQTYLARRTANTVETVHTLVNSRMGGELFVGLVAARALHEQNPNPENAELLRVAEIKLKQHQQKQAVADADAHH